MKCFSLLSNVILILTKKKILVRNITLLKNRQNKKRNVIIKDYLSVKSCKLIISVHYSSLIRCTGFL